MKVGCLFYPFGESNPFGSEAIRSESPARLSTEALFPNSPVWLGLPEHSKYSMPNINTTPAESNLKNYRQVLYTVK